jgi:multidrug efflux pump
MYPAAAVNGNFSPGTSTGDGIALVEKLAETELPARMAYEWTELTFLEKQSRSTGGQVFLLSVAFVFLVLAALYESWAFPFAVMLVVPVCVACSLAAVWVTDPSSAAQSILDWNADPAIPRWLKPNDWALAAARWIDDSLVASLTRRSVANGIGKQDVNVFTQVGFVVLIGLACKNAILIVEFAKVARDSGTDLRTAILDACKLRYRPIMMTSVAFMLGVLPLALARGAGSEMRQAIGVAVLGGMLGVTIFGIFLTPVFFASVDRLKRGPVFSHPSVVAAGTLGIYVLKLKFLRPIVLALKEGVESAARRLRGRKPMNPT